MRKESTRKLTPNCGNPAGVGLPQRSEPVSSRAASSAIARLTIHLDSLRNVQCPLYQSFLVPA